MPKAISSESSNRMRIRLLTLGAVIQTAALMPATAAALRPHEAVYDLTLDRSDSDISGAQGRIALQLKQDACEALSLDYRFLVRFQQETETTMTDQRTLSRETVKGDRFEFETRSTIDGAEQETVQGKAENGPGGTHIAYEKPVAREVEIELATFPLHHTAQIIEKAQMGQRIFETRLFDGDNEADKGLTTTALIAPFVEKPADKPSEAVATQLAGLRSWLIIESYYNKDSDKDGMPIFETRYRLYENGVSDDLKLDFGSYALKGHLSHLSLMDASCPTTR